MKMGMLGTAFAAVLCSMLALSCTVKNDQANADAASPAANVSEAKPSPEGDRVEVLPQVHDGEKAPAVESFGTFDLMRTSTNKDSAGIMVPPYDSAEVLASFGKEPKIGEKVTVVPLTSGIEPFYLTIRGSAMKSEGCTEEDEKPFWEVSLDPITSRQILAAEPREGRSGEFPFDVFLIYPAVAFAKNVPEAEWKKGLLPAGIATETVWAAIDIDNDAKPDLLDVRFCCKAPTQKIGDKCDLTCGKTFKKSGGKWNLLNESQPC